MRIEPKDLHRQRALTINAKPARPISCKRCGLAFIPTHPRQVECTRDHALLAEERRRLDHQLDLEHLLS